MTLKGILLCVIACFFWCGVTSHVTVGETQDFARITVPATKPSQSHDMLRKALDYLATSQNKDGSWGDGIDSFKASSLCLSAFLRSGETPTSAKYGQTIENAFRWLTSATPVSNSDRMLLATAISDYTVLRPNNVATNRIKDLLKITSVENEGAWRDFLAVSKLPDEGGRPSWAKSPGHPDHKKTTEPDVLAWSNTEECLRVYLFGLDCIRGGGDKWIQFERRLLQTIETKQNAKGAIEMESSGDAVTVTAIVSMTLSLPQHGTPKFIAPSNLNQGETAPQGQEIKVTVDK